MEFVNTTKWAWESATTMNCQSRLSIKSLSSVCTAIFTQVFLVAIISQSTMTRKKTFECKFLIINLVALLIVLPLKETKMHLVDRMILEKSCAASNSVNLKNRNHKSLGNFFALRASRQYSRRYHLSFVTRNPDRLTKN